MPWKDPQKRRESDLRYRESTVGREKAAERQRRRRARLREEAFTAYGDTCACCHEGHLEFLTFDHIAEDGAAHRREVGQVYSILAVMQAQGWPPILQTLCWNCNWAKHRYGICPHQVEARVEVPT
jgi:hypothetical protein